VNPKTGVESTEANEDYESEKKQGALLGVLNRSNRRDSAPSFPKLRRSGLASAATRFREPTHSPFPSFASVRNPSRRCT
jgi:hypothetical protein